MFPSFNLASYIASIKLVIGRNHHFVFTTQMQRLTPSSKLEGPFRRSILGKGKYVSLDEQERNKENRIRSFYFMKIQYATPRLCVLLSRRLPRQCDVGHSSLPNICCKRTRAPRKPCQIARPPSAQFPKAPK